MRKNSTINIVFFTTFLTYKCIISTKLAFYYRPAGQTKITHKQTHSHTQTYRDTEIQRYRDTDIQTLYWSVSSVHVRVTLSWNQLALTLLI